MVSTTYEIWLKIKEAVRQNPLITILVIFGGLLRLAGLFWGLPIFKNQYNFHPDEWTFLLASYSFPYHIIYEKYLQYPMFVPYLLNCISPFNLFFETISNILNMAITGRESEIDFVWTYFKIIGRTFTILLGTGSIILTYILGKRLYGKIAALTSAAFIAFALYAVQNASMFTPSVPSSFFMLVTLISAYYLLDNPTFPAYCITAFATAALVGSMYPGAVAAVSVLIIHTEVAMRSSDKWGGRIKFLIGKRFWFYVAVTFTTFMILSPGALIHFKYAVLSIVEELWRATHTLGSNRTSPHLWLSLGLRHIEMLGPCFTLLFVIALIWNLVRVDRKTLTLAIVPVICWIFFVNSMRARHMILLIPIYSLLVGRLMRSSLECRLRIIRYFMAALFAVSLVYTIYYNLDAMWSRYHDNRRIASEFMEENIPADSTVGMKCLEGGEKAYKHKHFKEFMWDFPYIEDGRYKLTDCMKNPEYLVLTEYSDKYPLTAVNSGLMKADVWPDEEGGLFWREKIPEPALMALYTGLLTGASECYNLIKLFPSQQTEYKIFRLHYELYRFKKVDWDTIRDLFLDPNKFYSFEYPSPEIRIYKRNDRCIAGQ